MSKIPWTKKTWNVSVGCTKVSAGCENCYAEKMAYRLARMGQKKYREVVDWFKTPGSKWSRWNGAVVLRPEILDRPLHWKEPCRIFVNSMSDLFHPGVPFEFIDKVFAVAALCPQHTFQILTKRADRMLGYFNSILSDKVYWEHAATRGDAKTRIYHEAYEIVSQRQESDKPNYNMWNGVWPLPNLIGMVTIENQEMADLRIPYLLQCGFKTTGVSVEPMLGPVDLNRNYDHGQFWGHMLNWVIIGPENGPKLKRREFKIKWAEDLVAQCDAASVPVFIKPSKHVQWPDDLKNRQAYPIINNQ